MSLFPRYAQNDFGPMFRLLDDWNSFAQQTRAGGSDLVASATPRSFNPKFDVKESKDAYTLEGELPGIELDNVAVEWTDTATLSIKGRSEYRREEGSRTAAPAHAQGRITTEGDAAANANNDSNNNGYHKPTVEDDNPNAVAVAKDGAVATHEGGPQVKHARGGNGGSRYWVSERSVGEFTRVFSFPHRVDQDKVKASLKNGILSVVVPKAAAPENRRVNIRIE